MKYFIFDTETSGLCDNDEVIQLAGFLLDDNMMIEKVVNCYCNTNKVISPKAIEVHGITNAKLWEYSKQRTLEDFLEDNLWLYNAKDTIFIGYNTPFDIKKVNYTLQSNNVRRMDMDRMLNPLDEYSRKMNFGRSITAIPDKTNGRNYNLDIMSTLARHHHLKRWISQEKAFDDYIGSDKKAATLNSLLKVVKHFDVYLPKPLDYHDALYDAYVTMLLFTKYKYLYIG